MSWLDRSETECQPCASFTPHEEDGPYGPTPHECFAPFDATWPQERCGKKVYWCASCSSDHHEGGYNSCRFPRGCAFNHPVCVARLAASAERES